MTPSRDAILTDAEMADVLHISEEKLAKADLPTCYFGRDRRYVYGVVVDCLAERARGDIPQNKPAPRKRRPKMRIVGGSA